MINLIHLPWHTLDTSWSWMAASRLLAKALARQVSWKLQNLDFTSWSLMKTCTFMSFLLPETAVYSISTDEDGPRGRNESSLLLSTTLWPTRLRRSSLVQNMKY